MRTEVNDVTHLVRRSLLVCAIGFILVVTTAAVGADAKASDAVGQNPTDGYDGGRLGQIARRETSIAYIEGIGFAISADIKFK